MENPIVWPGSSSFSPGKTPFGFYDSDSQFQTDADKVANFCARRLGYPLVDIELQDLNFYTAFEEAITTYGNEVYSYKIYQDYLNLEGLSTGSSVNNSIFTPNLDKIIKISDQYGAEAGVGGNIDNKQGSITLQTGVQAYDLNQWAEDNSIPDGELEIRRIFYEAPPAIVKYFDPYATTGAGMMNFMDSFGWGSYSPAINFLLMPMNFDIQKLQAIELNDTIRKSNYSFELMNNQLRIFPIPLKPGVLFFDYIHKSDRLNNSINNNSSLVSNIFNVPYQNPSYVSINSIGRSWIFEYTLALAKEMLGYIRGKYSQIPIPNDNVTLNQSDLLGSASDDKKALLEKLKEYLKETSRDKLLERRNLESKYHQEELMKIPYTIYVG